MAVSVSYVHGVMEAKGSCFFRLFLWPSGASDRPPFFDELRLRQGNTETQNKKLKII
jgi:hypothetical protein